MIVPCDHRHKQAEDSVEGTYIDLTESTPSLDEVIDITESTPAPVVTEDKPNPRTDCALVLFDDESFRRRIAEHTFKRRADAAFPASMEIGQRHLEYE